MITYQKIHSDMKIAYIAHPIGGDVQGNLEKIKEIVRQINLEEPEVVPFVPYFSDCVAMDDNNLDERRRCMKNDRAILKSGVVDEVRLYGDQISNGMRAEVELAHDLGIPVRPMTAQTLVEYRNIVNTETKMIRATVSLLSSMVEGGERHSSHSKSMIEFSLSKLDSIEQRLKATPVNGIEEDENG